MPHLPSDDLDEGTSDNPAGWGWFSVALVGTLGFVNLFGVFMAIFQAINGRPPNHDLAKFFLFAIGVGVPLGLVSLVHMASRSEWRKFLVLLAVWIFPCFIFATGFVAMMTSGFPSG